MNQIGVNNEVKKQENAGSFGYRKIIYILIQTCQLGLA